MSGDAYKYEVLEFNSNEDFTISEFDLNEIGTNYLAKGGVQSKDYLYAGSNKIDKFAWFSADSSMQMNHLVHFDRTQIVGAKQLNELNIYDMSGNVWERCIDGYDKNFYNHSPVSNPKGKGFAAFANGRSWYNPAVFCIITNRDFDSRVVKDDDLRFRTFCIKHKKKN